MLFYLIYYLFFAYIVIENEILSGLLQNQVKLYFTRSY